MSGAASSSLQTKFFKSHNGSGQITAYRVFNKRSGRRNSIPLIMIQGMSAVGIVDYHDLASALSDKRAVVVFDNRDIGESTWTSDEQTKAFTLEDLARDVVHLVQVRRLTFVLSVYSYLCSILQHLGYQEVDILGHSMGGKWLLGL
jgi:pimeloyl-ACP methyl ester carboxylesterase